MYEIVLYMCFQTIIVNRLATSYAVSGPTYIPCKNDASDIPIPSPYQEYLNHDDCNIEIQRRLESLKIQPTWKKLSFSYECKPIGPIDGELIDPS